MKINKIIKLTRVECTDINKKKKKHFMIMPETDHGDTLLRCREKYCKQKESTEERYKKCGLLNLIQHIDIHGTFCSSYHENRRQCSNSGSLGVTSVMSHSSQFLTTIQGTQRLKPHKLEKLSVATKQCSLYPGHDILSRKKKFVTKLTTQSNFLCKS